MTTYYRSLRDARLVTKAGRGPSAAKMTPMDASRTLIAIGGSRFEREPAAKIVSDFEKVQSDHSSRRKATITPLEPGRVVFGDDDPVEGEGRWHLDGFALPILQALPSRHSFADALVAFIETFMSGNFEEGIEAAHPGRRVLCNVNFNLYGPEPRADISVEIWVENTFRYSEDIGYFLAEQIDKNASNCAEVEEALAREYGEMDLEIRRRFGLRTLEAVAEILAQRTPI